MTCNPGEIFLTSAYFLFGVCLTALLVVFTHQACQQSKHLNDPRDQLIDIIDAQKMKSWKYIILIKIAFLKMVLDCMVLYLRGIYACPIHENETIYLVSDIFDLFDISFHLLYFLLRLRFTFQHVSRFRLSSKKICAGVGVILGLFIIVTLGSLVIYYGNIYHEFRFYLIARMIEELVCLIVLLFIAQVFASRVTTLNQLPFEFRSPKIKSSGGHHHHYKNISSINNSGNSGGGNNQLGSGNLNITIKDDRISGVSSRISGISGVSQMNELELINVATKQTFILLVNFVFVLIYVIFVLIEAIYYIQATDIISSFTNALQTFVTGITIWLTFEFAEDQYDRLFAKYDDMCLDYCRTRALNRLAAGSTASGINSDYNRLDD